MANISQNIFDKTRLFRRLAFQQGKPVGDYELNELQDILHEFQSDTREFVGAFGFWGDGFLVEATGNPNEILIRKGLMITGDSVILLAEDTTIDNLTTPGSSRTDEVYLQIAIQEVGKTEYPDIANPDTQLEQAKRYQYSLTLGVAEDGDYSASPVPGEDQLITFATMNRAVGSDTVVKAEINDERGNYSRTYLKGTADDTLKLVQTGGLGVDLERGDVEVYGTSYILSAVSTVVLDESLSYLYINEGGSLVIDVSRPTGKFLELWRVTASAGTITGVEDRRRFAPSGLTGIVQRQTVTQESIRDLFPNQNDPVDMQVYVEPGIGSYGKVAIDFSGGLSPTFTAPTVDPKIDLLYMDGNGILQIDPGVEGAGTPPFHSGKLPIAEVSLAVGQTEITDADIRDVRPLFNVGGSSATIDDGPGTYVLSSGLGLGNTLLKPSWTYGESFAEITFDSTAAGGTLSWAGDIEVRFLTSSGVIFNTIAGPASLTAVADGDVVYFDIVRTGTSTISLVRHPGAFPSFTDNRQIFGQRLGNHFVLQGGQVLYDQQPAVYTASGIDLNRWRALQGASSPGPTNVFATVDDIPTNLVDLSDVSASQSAAFAAMVSPSGANRIATINEVLAATGTVYQEVVYTVAGWVIPSSTTVYGTGVAPMSITTAVTGTYWVTFSCDVYYPVAQAISGGIYLAGGLCSGCYRYLQGGAGDRATLHTHTVVYVPGSAVVDFRGSSGAANGQANYMRLFMIKVG